MAFAVADRVCALTLRHQIADRVRQAILDGSLAPGERLVERNLASQLGASLTAAREAVIQLEAEGLVTKRSNATTHVTKLSRDDVLKIFEVRSVLERHAVSLAAQRATVEQVIRLEELHSSMMESATQKNAQLYIQRDFCWHEAVWLATGNEILAATLKRLIVPLFGFSTIRTVSREGFDLILDAQFHLPILEAIGSKAPEAAASAFDSAMKRWMSQGLKGVEG